MMTLAPVTRGCWSGSSESKTYNGMGYTCCSTLAQCKSYAYDMNNGGSTGSCTADSQCSSGSCKVWRCKLTR